MGVLFFALLLWQQGCAPLAPCYTAESIVNSASFRPGAGSRGFITIFGTNLAWSETARTAHDASWGLGGVHVSIGAQPALVLYASPGQVNALLPTLVAGEGTLWLSRDGVAGPAVRIRIEEFAPALFQLDAGTAIALRHPGWEPATREYPARPGEIVALFATGLGPLDPPAGDADRPETATPIARRRDLRVLLNGTAVEDGRIEYAGCAPGYYGLYQINLRLPERLDKDPEVRLRLAEHLSPEGVYLRVSAAAPQ